MNQFMAPQAICRFAAAGCDVTPPIGMYHRMWGAARHDQSRGIHRPLTATALVFQPVQQTDQLQIVIALDHCLLFPPEVDAIIRRVCKAGGVGAEKVLLAFSHTHAAGLMDPRRHELKGGELIGPYLDDLADKLAGAVQTAQAEMQPATITYATGRCSLAANRDYWDEQRKQFVCGFNPGTPADDTLLVCRVTGTNEQLLATIVNYGCHPTTLAWDNQMISPDYPGAMREVVEQATGAPCVFLQGACGELGPREGFVGETAVADRNGRQLGFAALSALESLPPAGTSYKYRGPVVSGATLGVWQHQRLTDAELERCRVWKTTRRVIALSYQENMPDLAETQRKYEYWQSEFQRAVRQQDDLVAAEARAMAERMRRWLTRLKFLPHGDTFPYPVSIWRAGDAIWLAVDGEPYSQLQSELRSRFPNTPIVVIVLANGSRAWYLPDRDSYGTGKYQESMANLRRGSLEQLIDNLSQEVAELLQDSGVSIA